jgi:predicted metal-dependent enzyme (double-stranded beta helix superfamily)
MIPYAMAPSEIHMNKSDMHQVSQTEETVGQIKWTVVNLSAEDLWVHTQNCEK